MNFLFRFLYLLTALFATAFAKEAAKSAEASSGMVPMLTSENFDAFIKENPVALVKFMAPWCGHCKKLAPEYEAAAEELKKKGGIPLAEVDATADSELSKKYNVQGFPTMYLFRNGNPEPYTGGRTKATIIEWIEKMTGPAVEWIDAKDLADKTKGLVAFVGKVTSKKSDAAATFEKVASSSRSKGKFFAVEDPAVTEATVTVHREGEDAVSTAIASQEKLVAWVETESFPLLGPINPENYAQYAARSKQWAWFAGNPEDYEKYGPPMRKVSKNYRTEFNFIWLNTDDLKHHAEAALGLKDFPAVAVVYDDSKYHLTGEITEKQLTKFIENVKAGKVKRFLKTEPVPEKNDEPVKVVVGSQFSEMVLAKDKDVFLKIYAPWCGHCKKLAPTWDELAEKTKGSKNLVIAKLDGTANEPDAPGFDYHGFPTLYFVPAGSKTPMAYDGERNLESMIAFLKKNAVHEVVVSEEVEEEEEKDEL